jgi:hypothetical protein
MSAVTSRPAAETVQPPKLSEQSKRPWPQSVARHPQRSVSLRLVGSPRRLRLAHDWQDCCLSSRSVPPRMRRNVSFSGACLAGAPRHSARTSVGVKDSAGLSRDMGHQRLYILDGSSKGRYFCNSTGDTRQNCTDSRPLRSRFGHFLPHLLRRLCYRARV